MSPAEFVLAKILGFWFTVESLTSQYAINIPMIYTNFAEITKSTAHIVYKYAVPHTIPRTASIGVISATAGCIAELYYQAFIRQRYIDIFVDTSIAGVKASNFFWPLKNFNFCGWSFRDSCKDVADYTVGWAAALPWASKAGDALTYYYGFGTMIGTAIVLNALAEIFFGIKHKNDAKNPLEEFMKKHGGVIPIPALKPPIPDQPLKAQISKEPQIITSPSPQKKEKIVVKKEDIFGNEDYKEGICCTGICAYLENIYLEVTSWIGLNKP